MKAILAGTSKGQVALGSLTENQAEQMLFSILSV